MRATVDWIENTGAKGNRKNFEQLRDLLHRYCLSVTKSRSDAEDLEQTTWMKVFKTVNGFNHHNPEALLLRIAKNTWIDESRRRSVHNRAVQVEKAIMEMPDHSSLEIELAFQALVNHMSPLQMTVFMLRDVFGYSIAEAAAILETTQGAIKAALHRARIALEDVRNDLINCEFPWLEEEGLRDYLRALTAAYQSGDIETLIRLTAVGEVEPVAVIGIVQDRMLREPLSLRHGDCQPGIRMAA